MPGGNPTDLGGLVEDFLGESSSVGDTPATSSPTDSLLSGLADDASDGLRFGEKHPDFEHEISGALHAWCQTLAKTVKSVQVYDRNNRMLRQFMQRAHRQLTQITARVPELTLSV